MVYVVARNWDASGEVCSGGIGITLQHTVTQAESGFFIK